MATKPRAKPRTTRKLPARRRRPHKRVKVTIALFRCRRCKQAFNNPFKRLFHTCTIGFTAAQRAAARRNLEAARQARKATPKGGSR